MAATFVLKKGSSGKFYFNLVAANGQVLATSESYESKASAPQGIECSSAMPPTRRSTTRPAARVTNGTGVGVLSPPRDGHRGRGRSTDSCSASNRSAN
jgi:uncharacterized protein